MNKLKEVLIDGFYISNEEKEFLKVFKEVFTLRTLIVGVPIMLILFYGYCQLIDLAEYFHYVI